MFVCFFDQVFKVGPHSLQFDHKGVTCRSKGSTSEIGLFEP